MLQAVSVNKLNEEAFDIANKDKYCDDKDKGLILMYSISEKVYKMLSTKFNDDTFRKEISFMYHDIEHNIFLNGKELDTNSIKT